jgi:hypothetical protein
MVIGGVRWGIRENDLSEVTEMCNVISPFVEEGVDKGNLVALAFDELGAHELAVRAAVITAATKAAVSWKCFQG